MRKTLCVNLALLLIVSVVTGCGQEASDEASQDAGNEISLQISEKIPRVNETEEPVAFSGRWRMTYGEMSSDPEVDLAMPGLSYFEFSGGNKVKFQFSFEYIQYFVKEGEYTLVEESMYEDTNNNGWYYIIDADNELEDQTYDHFICRFTKAGDGIMAVISGEGESTVYTCFYEKAEE
ncbi:hypothetical protein [Butyrivibrio sp. FCS014]|uniref:hypothetical protein n=1 Tax=Butyrivibrio sp. FCS014 TaxID=1408304 RepID=UPI0004634C70|nr:hypothetical protein [Butyrivibrio sp. FCS014]